MCGKTSNLVFAVIAFGMVWTAGVCFADPFYATLPYPADGEENVEPIYLSRYPSPHWSYLTLIWAPGTYAKEQDIYFGTDFVAVRDATDPFVPPGRGRKSKLAGSKYEPTGLKLNQTYYWRIDSVYSGYPGSPWKGDVWKFTTIEALVMDDFESYADNGALQNNWPGSGGSTVLLSTNEHRGGDQSMELRYSNEGSNSYSEAALTFDCNTLWASSGGDVLAVFFKGKAGNDADSMYAVVEDANGATATVAYGGEVGDLQKAEWQAWGIALQELADAGVDTSAVKKLVVGIGGRDAPVSGASGTIYIDDIELRVVGCVPEVQPIGDFTGDCVVDFEDVAVMASEWFRNDLPVEPEEPDDANGLMVWYKFDETSGLIAEDSSGNGFDGTVYYKVGIPNPRWEPNGKIERDLAFVVEYGVLIVDPCDPDAPNMFSDVNEAVTITFWVYGYTTYDPQAVIFQAEQHPDATPCKQIISIYVNPISGDKMTFKTGLGEVESLEIGPPEKWNEWNHYAFVKDAGTGITQIYLNGCLMAEKTEQFELIGGVEAASIGMSRKNYGKLLAGRLDDFRIYDYALSQAEVVGVRNDGSKSCPFESPANIYDEEPPTEKAVNFKDYSLFAENWFEEQFWP